jgi:CheY-like chemotaxis protein
VEPPQFENNYLLEKIMTETHGNILLVDDDRQTRLKLTRILEAQGHTVNAVESGQTALKTLAGELFDVILLDILMPGMDGFEVLETLKADTRLSNIPVIVISAVEDEHSEDKCMQLGAQAYLSKPVDANLLNTRIAECLNQDS